MTRQKLPAVPLVEIPDFVPVVKTEGGIRVPAGALGRQHTLRTWGSGTGHIDWSPVTQEHLSRSGWRPRRFPPGQPLPTTYSVRFVGVCPACAGRKAEACPRCKGRAPMPITGWVLVSPEHPRARRQATPVPAIAFERAEWRFWKERQLVANPRQPWTRDGRGPAKLTAEALGCARDMLVVFDQVRADLPESEVAQALLEGGFRDDLVRQIELLQELLAKATHRGTAPKPMIMELAKGRRH